MKTGELASAMEFPVTGLIILVAAIWFFFFKPRLLYSVLIISIPFSATAVVNFTWAGAASGEQEKSLMAWQFFAMLWVLREALSCLPQWKRRGWFLTRRERIWLLAFLGALIASLTVPLVLNGTEWVMSWVVGPFYRGPAMIQLRFTSYNVTQSAYMVFGVLFTIFVAAKNWLPERLFYTLRLYAGSCIFAAAWGIYQLWCNLTGHAYAAQIFNTSRNFSATGYTETLTAGTLLVGRISSVATEPSVLAEELLIALAVLMVCLGLRHPVLRHGWNGLAVALIGIVLLMSTSSTAYFGILAALALSGVTLSRVGSQQWKHYLTIAVVVLAVGALLTVLVPLVSKIGQTAILLKYINGSGQTRLESVQIAVRDFLRYPILGVGWKAVDSWDFLVLLLANTGLIGTLAFGGFLLPTFRGLWEFTLRRNLMAAVLLPVLALVVILDEGAGLNYATGYNWLFFGLAVGALAVAKSARPFGAAIQRALLGTNTP